MARAPKGPKLTEDEISELRDMLVSTTCGQRPELTHLAELKLCNHWKGRFGWVATITHAGRDLMAARGYTDDTEMKRKREERLAKEPDHIKGLREDMERIRAGKLKSETAPRRVRGNDRRSAVALESNYEAETKPLYGSAEPSPISVTPAPVRQQQRNEVAAIPPASQRRSRRPPQEPAPNTRKAVRITRGRSVMYYPVSMFESLNHDQKELVETVHPFYSSRSLAASKSDRPVLQERTGRVRSQRPRNR